MKRPLIYQVKIPVEIQDMENFHGSIAYHHTQYIIKPPVKEIYIATIK